MTNKPTLVIGASTNPARYSHLAIHSLRKHGHDVVALATRTGQVADVSLQTSFPENNNVHTITMYLGAQRQEEYYKPILDLKPERVIFNPGSENQELVKLLENNGIEAIEACTLVLLSTGQF
ncbi:MAG: CoA-binding protein [Prolixibacteraceae bacterium]|nr:CoA-binding protein [Prolixibacteraceae bacterium]